MYMYMYLYMYKEHYKNTQFEYVTKLKKKSFQILMVKRVLKNKIMIFCNLKMLQVKAEV